MFGGAADDDTEGDQDIRQAVAQHHLSANGDLKSARHAIHGNAGVRGDLVDLLAAGVEQALDVGVVVKARHDGDGDRLVDRARAAGSVL